MNYDEILDRCLEKMPSDMDIREGSFIYTALAPLCYELANAYFEIENMMNLAFLDTSYGEYLDKSVAIIGIERKTAVKCQKIAEISAEVDIISQKFSCGQYIFEVLEEIDENKFIIEATEYGIEYNTVFGNLTSILNINGINSAEITENYVLATEIEDDESFRTRTISKITAKSFGGNIPDYEQNAMELNGVDSVCVFTANDLGIGFVHLVILGSEKTLLSEQICEKCLEKFNGTETEDALAPIGHTVSVSTCEYVYVDIVCKIVVDDSEDTNLILENAKKQIIQYVDDLNFKNSVVSRMKMIAYLLQIEAILDVSEFYINGVQENFALTKTYAKFEVCKLNDITIEINSF